MNTQRVVAECLVLIVFAMNALHVCSSSVAMPAFCFKHVHACFHEMSRLALLRPSLYAAMAIPLQTLPSMRLSEDEINEWNASIEVIQLQQHVRREDGMD